MKSVPWMTGMHFMQDQQHRLLLPSLVGLPPVLGTQYSKDTDTESLEIQLASRQNADYIAAIPS